MKSWDTKARNLEVRSILAPGLIVSCQAWQGTPLLSLEIIAPLLCQRSEL